MKSVWQSTRGMGFVLAVVVQPTWGCGTRGAATPEPTSASAVPGSPGSTAATEPVPVASSQPTASPEPAPASSPPAPVHRIDYAAGPITDADGARAAFERAWAEAIAQAMKKHRPKVHAHWQQVLDQKHHVSTNEEPCPAIAQLVRSTLGPDEMHAIVLGSVADLDAATACWTVSISRGFATLMVSFRADDATPLLVYWPPEG